ncbi:MAG: PAS domain S-box protein [Ferruginibacter sp.]
MAEPVKTKSENLSFLTGKGEMHRLTRLKNWSATSIGTPDHWPQSLRTTLSIILNSKFPMFLWWGPELLCFYNDAYRPSLGKTGKHPDILGMPAKEAWPEIWDIIQPLIKQVLDGGEATWSEDQLIPIYRNGKLEDVYWTFSYSPVNDESGNVSGVLVTCNETTQKVLIQKTVEKNEKKFRDMVLQAPVGILILKGPEYIADVVNEKYLQLIDRDEKLFIGKPLFESLPEVKEVVEPLLNNVFKTGISFNGTEFPVMINRHGKKEQTYFNFIYKALLEDDGAISGVIVIANEVTSLVQAKHSLMESELHFRMMLMQSPIPMTIFRGPDFIIELANTEMLTKIWRKQASEVIGKSALEVFPELNQQKYPELLRSTLESGKPHRDIESVVYVQGNDGIKKFYLDYEYAPLIEPNGKASGIMITVNDVSEKVETRKKIEESEERLSMAIESTKLGTWDYHPNSGKLKWSDECRNIYALPENVEINFALFSKLIYAEDYDFVQEEVNKAMDPSGNGEYDIVYRILRYDDRSIRWIRSQGQVYFDTDKKPERFIGTVVDITDQKKAEEEIARVAAIVQSSDDAIISKTLDGIVTSWNTASERMFGYTAEEMIGQPITKIIPPDRISEEFDILQRIRSGERVNHFETKRMTKDKRLLDISITVSPVKDKHGKILGASKIARDVTERKKAQQALQESELRLRIATEGTKLATWDLNLQTLELLHSPRLAEIFGQDQSKMLSLRQLRTQVHADEIVHVEKAFATAMKSSEQFFEVRIIKPDKEIRWIKTKGKVIYDEKRLPLRMIGTMMDISEEKNVIQSLEESKQRLSIAVGAAALGTWELDFVTNNVIYSKRYLEVLGFAENEQPGHAEILKRIHPDDLELRNQSMTEALKMGALELEVRIILEDKDIRWIKLAGRVLYNEKKEAVRILGTVMDITEQKKAYNLLRESEERFRQLANSMPQQVWTSDTKGNLNYFNQSVYDYSGLTKKEVESLGWLSIVHPDDREENVQKWMEAIASGEDFLLEHRFKKHNGEFRWQLSRAIPIKDASGNIQLWVGTSTDIHDIKEAEEQKDFFISVASHELKTPITSIKGYVQILMRMHEQSEDKFLKNSLRTVDKQIVTLTTLIEDLLDLSKIKSGSLQLNKEEFSINAMIRESVEEISHIQPDYKINFVASDECMVFADRGRIGQVLINFLTNAIKYSPASKTINIENKVYSNFVTVSVADKGIGINKKDQDKIFQRFYRVEGQDEKTFPGFGIGLFIASEIIKRHSGKIGVESELSKGSVFYFSLPLNNLSNE